MTREVDADRSSGSTKQVVAHSWQASDRFVPRVVVRPMQSLMAVETSSAALILIATVSALVVANTPMVGAYEHFWETTLARRRWTCTCCTSRFTSWSMTS